jgi:hypothetical protein
MMTETSRRKIPTWLPPRRLQIRCVEKGLERSPVNAGAYSAVDGERRIM